MGDVSIVILTYFAAKQSIKVNKNILINLTFFIELDNKEGTKQIN